MSRGAPVELISWRAGKRWAGWHIADTGTGAPLCGTVVPDEAPRCTASRASGPLLLEDLCKKCLARFAMREDPQPELA